MKCLRSVWAICIVLSFILGYLMGLYLEPSDDEDGMIADVRENPMSYVASEEEYGFHRRKNRAQK
jgi:hypothetical protein